MLREIDVPTGEVGVGSGEAVIVANALGSCVAVVAFDPGACAGGIAHVMLPGKAPGKDAAYKCRYAVDAIGELLYRLAACRARKESLAVWLAGGGNVLMRDDDTVCAANVSSVRAILAQQGLRARNEAVGGTVRRRVRLLVPSGTVWCEEGGAPAFCLSRSSVAAAGDTMAL
jgi:chemotaxis protein CheD